MCGKFKFSFLELSGLLLVNIFNPQLIESVDSEACGYGRPAVPASAYSQ